MVSPQHWSLNGQAGAFCTHNETLAGTAWELSFESNADPHEFIGPWEQQIQTQRSTILPPE